MPPNEEDSQKLNARLEYSVSKKFPYYTLVSKDTNCCLTQTKRGSNSNSKNSESIREPLKDLTESKNYCLPWYLPFCGYISCIFLFIVSWIREFIYGIGPLTGINKTRYKENNRDGYTTLFDHFEGFYIRNMYRRQRNVFENTIGSVPGATVTYIEKVSDDANWTFKLDENNRKECVNLASYNYLGFAEKDGLCTELSVTACNDEGISCCSPAHEFGARKIHYELEKTVSEFLGVEDAIAVGMGFATNSLNLPCLISKGCLVISDQCNHASAILGIRLSGATVNVFKHNDPEDLERILRQAIIKGNQGEKWNKILIIIEGIYSMEGTICKLPEIVRIKKKYGAYLYLDEAHSVGAMGSNGRGVVDYFGINPNDVDVLMGTFTKSFGGAGGYIAGSKKLIDYLRTSSHAKCYAGNISPPVARQVISSMRCIMDQKKDGMKRIHQLALNTKYFRSRLKEMGFIVCGDDDSPVIPIMLFMQGKVMPFVLKCREKGVVSVGVGFPGTKLNEERMRFCVSAGHSKEMLESALKVISDVGDYTNCKYGFYYRNK